MALIDCESFGLSTKLSDFTGSRAFLEAYSGGVFNDGNSPFPGDAYVSILHLLDGFIKALPGTYTTFFAGFRVQANPGAFAIFRDSNGSLCFGVRLTSNNNMQIVDGNNNVLATSRSGVFPATGWFYLEVGGFVSQSAGTASVLINGEEVLTATAINTVGLGNGTVQQYGLYSSASADSCSTTHWYFCDNTGTSPQNSFLGDVRVQCMRPTADVDAAFAPNGDAANYENVGMAAPNPAADFNSSSTVGATDTFDFQPVAGGLISIMGVAIKAVATKSDAGLRGFATTVTSGAQTQQGTPVMLGTTVTLAEQIIQNDPGTGAQWTQGAVDALTAGYTITS